MTFEDFNNAGSQTAIEELMKCCGSRGWAVKMSNSRPFRSLDIMVYEGESIWYNCSEEDWKASFEDHPKIGDLKSLKKKYGTAGEWAANEQAGAKQATTYTLTELAEANIKYEDKYGYKFIVCATGKSASEMLEILESRLNNTPEKELMVAMEEQNKITKIRLEKLFDEEE